MPMPRPARPRGLFFLLANAYLAAGAALLLAGCVERPAPPDDLIAADSMAILLADLHLNQAYHSTGRAQGEQPITRPLTLYRGAIAMRDVLAARGVGPDRFERSMHYYAAVPIELDSISLRAIAELEARQARLQPMPDTLRGPQH